MVIFLGVPIELAPAVVAHDSDQVLNQQAADAATARLRIDEQILQVTDWLDV